MGVSSVKYMKYMFVDCHVFNKPIGNWNVSSVTDMNGMFSNAAAFNKDIGNWDVSSVRDMNFMFAMYYNTYYRGNDYQRYFNLPDLLKETHTDHEFELMQPTLPEVPLPSAFNKDIGNWDVSSVTITQRMFAGASHLTGRLKTGTCRVS